MSESTPTAAEARALAEALQRRDIPEHGDYLAVPRDIVLQAALSLRQLASLLEAREPFDTNSGARENALEEAAQRADDEEEPTLDQLLVLRPYLSQRDVEALQAVALAVVRATKKAIADGIRALQRSAPPAALPPQEKIVTDQGFIQALVDRFLAWPLPESVRADLCATERQPGRIGTHLLTADEARQLFEYLFASAPPAALEREGWRPILNKLVAVLDWNHDYDEVARREYDSIAREAKEHLAAPPAASVPGRERKEKDDE